MADAIFRIRTRMMTPAAGVRNNVANVVVVLTDEGLHNLPPTPVSGGYNYVWAISREALHKKNNSHFKRSMA